MYDGGDHFMSRLLPADLKFIRSILPAFCIDMQLVSAGLVKRGEVRPVKSFARRPFGYLLRGAGPTCIDDVAGQGVGEGEPDLFFYYICSEDGDLRAAAIETYLVDIDDRGVREDGRGSGATDRQGSQANGVAREPDRGSAKASAGEE